MRLHTPSDGLERRWSSYVPTTGSSSGRTADIYGFGDINGLIQNFSRGDHLNWCLCMRGRSEENPSGCHRSTRCEAYATGGLAVLSRGATGAASTESWVASVAAVL